MKILIPLDGSKFAEEILEPAANFAERCHAVVRLIQVVRGSTSAPWILPPTTDEPHNVGAGLAMGVTSTSGGGAGVRAETLTQTQDGEKQEAEDYLTRIASQRFPGGAGHTVVIGDDPAAEIVKYVRAEQIDLIAIATHGRSGLARLMLGSVAVKLLKAQTAPLMLVHPKGRGKAAGALGGQSR
jgi:nucleotide-binding universal stress UspA family protein